MVIRKNLKRVLDKTTLDDKIMRGAKNVADKTTVDDKLIFATKKATKAAKVDINLVAAAKRVKQGIRHNIAKAVLAAFGFLIALVWRDVIKDGVAKMVEYMNITGDGYLFTIITALVTTIICVVGILYFSRWSEK